MASFEEHIATVHAPSPLVMIYLTAFGTVASKIWNITEKFPTAPLLQCHVERQRTHGSAPKIHNIQTVYIPESRQN